MRACKFCACKTRLLSTATQFEKHIAYLSKRQFGSCCARAGTTLARKAWTGSSRAPEPRVTGHDTLRAPSNAASAICSTLAKM